MDTKRAKPWLIGAAAIGIALGSAGIAGAATGDTSSSSSSSTAPAASATRPDPASLPNGPGETLLTGTTADQVSAAALKAVPGGTIIRVESDSTGSPYEAHVKKADGTEVTVKLDSSFSVTATEDGFGRGPDGQQGPPNGQAPNSNDNSSSSSSSTGN